MADPFLDEIWRVRAELLRRYGGWDGYFKHIQELDRAHRRRKQQKATKPRRKAARRS